MNDISDGIGGTAMGGSHSRAAGPQPNAGDGHFHETTCLNCGTQLVGSHCHECGQEAHLHRTVGAFLHDMMHGVLHLDGKIWRTLPMLVLKPGHLTREYIDGKRRSHVSPIALFLFSVFAMFAVFSMVGLSVPTDLRNGTAEGDVPVSIEDAEAELEAARARLATLEEGSEDYAIAATRVENLETARNVLQGFSGEQTARFNLGGTGIAQIDKGLTKWRENPSLMIYKLQSSGYKFSWLLIPLSLPFMWLMFFWKPQFGMYDHSVFVTYSIAFMSLLFIVASLLAVAGAPGWIVTTLCTAVPVLHIYKQLRYGYLLTRAGALVRTSAALVFVSLVLILFLSILFLLGIWG
ncbi:DUF3667 domain-containing protein [Croceicoccus marinus]|uniref:DUF3667 domain-containing protein n=1 Tax=Croceicoccus marinus TaxID=450378 RepID=A0A1Z1FDC9_9SPHN|nr:DUF3667 domain-containing protein [Croceicoccus marinus]ARU16819.1 hypothetical protein A9D14_12360 [Croceicoccus marinus]